MVQFTMGRTTHGQVVLGAIRKQTEQSMRNRPFKQLPSMTSVSAPVSRFLPWVPCMMVPGIPFPALVAFGQGVLIIALERDGVAIKYLLSIILLIFSWVKKKCLKSQRWDRGWEAPVSINPVWESSSERKEWAHRNDCHHPNTTVWTLPCRWDNRSYYPLNFSRQEDDSILPDVIAGPCLPGVLSLLPHLVESHHPKA